MLRNFKNILFIALISIAGQPILAKPFVEGHLMGQFGNQLFIIAATVNLALDNGAVPVFPDLVESQEFNIPINHKMAFYHLETERPDQELDFTYYESHYFYEEIPYIPNMKIVGWFQSEKYFISHKEQILELFQPHPEILDYLHSKYGNIINHPNTVSIHLRTYSVELPEVEQCYPTYGLEYVEKAVELFPEDTLFVVFSNQMDWCKNVLGSLKRNVVYIEGENYIHDFYLMSMCKNNIICNSTFSWWAAYLNKNPSKVVVVPSKWYNTCYKSDEEIKDLIPSEWIVLQH